MNERQRVTSGSPFEASIGFCRAMRVGATIVVAGTASIADDGSTAHPGDAYRQTLRCLEIVGRALDALGGRMEDVVRTRVMIVPGVAWQDVGRAHGEVFSSHRPVSTMVVVAGLVRPDLLVEIEVDALVDAP
jgi:enamine deaminase RidA (YjgF/YER057c/UK114 family)